MIYWQVLVCMYEGLAQFVVSTIVPGSFTSRESFLHPGWGDWDFFIKTESKQNQNQNRQELIAKIRIDGRNVVKVEDKGEEEVVE